MSRGDACVAPTCRWDTGGGDMRVLFWFAVMVWFFWWIEALEVLIGLAGVGVLLAVALWLFRVIGSMVFEFFDWLAEPPSIEAPSLRQLPKRRIRRQTVTSAMKQAVWDRDGGRCRKCGSDQDLQFDHDIPVSKGGATSVENLRLLCRPCNLAKGAKIE